MTYKPYPYQSFATEHILAHDDVGSGLFLDMGLGKTVSTLTAIVALLDRIEISRVLVVAPKLVAESTWSDEAAKWDHTKHLRFSIVLGSERQRKEALAKHADIYVINCDNICWLKTYFGGAFPFDMLVLDESSKFKNASSARHKAIKMVRPLINRVVCLTGTPAAQGLMDLWGQVYILDMGKRLGKNITAYREAYFHEPYKGTGGKVVRGYTLAGEHAKDLEKNKNAQEIFAKIKDICISMKAEDYLDLPKRIDTITPVHLSPAIMAQYRDFEKEKVIEFIELEKTVNAVNAAALTGKLLQFANGALYMDKEHNFQEIHNEKIEALGERIEAANGSPVLVSYCFQSDIVRIMKQLKHLRPKLYTGKKDLDDWNKGKIPFLLGHPASMGHGLNMQDGGHHLEQFGRVWPLEQYLQLIARLDRQGQRFPVIANTLACPGTMEDNVIQSHQDKEIGQGVLMKYVKALVASYRK